MRGLIIALSIATLIAGCSKPDSNGSVATPVPTIKLETIAANHWVLRRIDGDSYSADMPATFSIDDDGSAKGFNGCNNYFGTPKLTNNQLSIDPMGSTRKFCDHKANALEAQFINVMSGPSTISIDGDSMLISKGESTLTFTKQ